AALDDVPGPEIFNQCTDEADRVDAEVRAEPAVFDGDDRFRHIGRQFGDPRFIAEEGAALLEDAAVGGKQHHAWLALGDLEQTLPVERRPDLGKSDAGDDEANEAEAEYE